MTESEPLSELTKRQEQLSTRIENKRSLLEARIPSTIVGLDLWTQTARVIRLGKAGAWLEKSITEVQRKLDQVTEEVSQRSDELTNKAQAYQKELEQRRTQLVQIEEVARYIPSQSIEQYKERLGQFEALKDTNPELRAAFQFSQGKQIRVDVDEEMVEADGRKRYFHNGVEVFPDGQAQPVTPPSQVEQPPVEPENRISLADFTKHLYGKDDQESITNARGLMGVNNKRGLAKLNLQAVIEGKGDQATVYLERLAQKDTAKLQAELEELIARRDSLQAKLDQGILENHDHMVPIVRRIAELEALLEITKAGEEKNEVEVEGIELKPEDIVITPTDTETSADVLIIPYEPSEEEKRSDEETKILDFVVSTLLANMRISFEDLQKELFSDKRIGKAPGGGRRLFIYQAKELKEMLRSALRKIREEAEITDLRKEWGSGDEQIWYKLHTAALKYSGGDMVDFLSKAAQEIDRAEREFYRNSPSPEKGGDKVAWIKI